MSSGDGIEVLIATLQLFPSDAGGTWNGSASQYTFIAFPVHPTQRIVVTITIIIAMLRSPNFITHEQHRYSAAEEKQGSGVLHLSTTKLVHAGVIGFALPSAIPAIVVVGAVVVPLAIRLVVLAVVGNHVA